MEASVDRWGPGAQTIWLSILNSYKFTLAPDKHTRSRPPLPSTAPASVRPRSTPSHLILCMPI